MIVDVENASPHTFVLDGEFLPSGELKASSRDKSIKAGATTRLEFAPSTVSNLQGVVWFVDSSKRNVYLSMAMSRTPLGATSFSCFAGVPPANLKSEMKSMLPVDKTKPMKAGDGSCEWIGTNEGVALKIPEEVPFFLPATAADYQVAASVAPGAETKQLEALSGGYPSEIVPAGEAEANFMAVTRPRDGMDGFRRGLTTAGMGVATGLATAIGAPVVGARQEGAYGAMKGLGVGVVGGVGLIVGGLVGGTAQVGRGLMQMPAAYRGRMEEKIWDQETGSWVDINLCEQEYKVETEKDDDDEDTAVGGAPSASKKTVKETEYYDLLNVPPDATPAQLKKAFYKEARQCHPDKNPGDASATAKFQKLNEVYQILSDPDMRKKYDKEGHTGVAEQKGSQLDASTFFSLLFGSERFVPWTGELHMAMQMDHVSKQLSEEPEDAAVDPETLSKKGKQRQHRREVRCATHLRDKTERFVYGRDEEGFAEQMRLEAHDLANAQFGPELLAALGEIYQLRAEIYLANELSGRFSMAKRMASIKHNAAVFKHGLHFYKNVAGSALRAKRVYTAASSAQAAAKKRDADSTASGGTPTSPDEVDEETAKIVEGAIDDALPTFLQTAWSYVVRDIDSTMKTVGRKFLQDKSVPWQIRVRRAQALRRLGQIFYETSQAEAAQQGDRSISSAAEEAKAKLQEAMIGAMKEK